MCRLMIQKGPEERGKRRNISSPKIVTFTSRLYSLVGGNGKKTETRGVVQGGVSLPKIYRTLRRIMLHKGQYSAIVRGDAQ